MDGDGGSVEDLRAQVSQLQAVMNCLESESEREDMRKCVEELQQLIAMLEMTNSNNSNSEVVGDQQGEDDEYTRFAAEIAAMGNENLETSSQEVSRNVSESNANLDSNQTGGINSSSVSDDEEDGNGEGETSIIEDELKALEGMKCLAPHEEQWGQIGYYPAMVSEVIANDQDDNGEEISSITDIKVKVIFLQPVVRSQLLCPFYQEDRCRFSNSDCRYSHGEVVLFSQLRDYSDPDYSKIVPSAKVLAKYHDDLWYKGTITRLTDDGNCEVVFDKCEEPQEVEIHETVPIDEDDEETYSSEGSDEEEEVRENEEQSVGVGYCDVLNIQTSEMLGEWEKHTKGIGSKLMMKMGYVMGSGLGKSAEGRTIPVDAVMVPQGMSLDHFMQLKERRKMGNNSFSVEKKLKRAQRKHAAREHQIANAQKKMSSVFDIINSQLTSTKKSADKKPKHVHVSKQSTSGLKKDLLTVGEDMKKVTKDIMKLKQAIKRAEGKDPTTEAIMRNKLSESEHKKEELEKLERNISREQKHRSDKRKLTEF